MAERLAYRRRAFRDGYGRFGFVAFGPAEPTGAAPLIVELATAEITVTSAWTVLLGATPLIIELTTAEISVSADWSPRMTVPLGTAAVSVTGAWTVVELTPLIVELATAEVSASGDWRALQRSLIALSPADISVMGWWATRLGSGPALPAAMRVMFYAGGVGTDITAVCTGDMPFTSTMGSVPTAELDLEDTADVVPWPFPPGFDPDEADPDSLPVLRLEVVDGEGLFEGQVVDWEREELFPGWHYKLRAQGWQRLLPLSPVFPWSSTTQTQEAPDGTVVTPDLGKFLGLGDGGVHPTDVAVIVKALESWTGPAFGVIDVPYRVSVGWTITPRGDGLDAVLQDIADRLGFDDVGWVQPGRVALAPEFHWRPVLRGGATTYHGPSRWIAPFHLTDDLTDPGGVVPSSVHESGSGGHIRRGVYVNAQRPDIAAHVISGPEYAGEDVISSATADYGVPIALGGSYMYGRRTWRRTYTAPLPPQPAGTPVPHIGDVLPARFGQTIPVLTYYTIRSVRARALLRGQGVGNLEFTLDFGDNERRSYVHEQRRIVEVKAKDAVVPVVTFEIVHAQYLGVPAEGDPPIAQYVTPRPIGPDGQRVELAGGRVRWSILIDDRSGSGPVDIGANVGDPSGAGLSMEAAETDIVWEHGDGARRWGFATGTLLTWRTEATLAGGFEAWVQAELI